MSLLKQGGKEKKEEKEEKKKERTREKKREGRAITIDILIFKNVINFKQTEVEEEDD